MSLRHGAGAVKGWKTRKTRESDKRRIIIVGLLAGRYLSQRFDDSSGATETRDKIEAALAACKWKKP